ncbi:MAG: hypothetical protein LBD02_08560 [Christensenellaceae bacterium]|jgi:hypothetical protein|nr:hypothetical protein [Christensenellaceae bacterium]
MKAVAPLAAEVSTLADELDKDENDRIDTALLNEVFQKRVDMLITEDKKLRRKAERLGLSHKVLSINALIAFVTAENPNLVEYRALAVKKRLMGEIDVNNEFFDSLREAYTGFNDWFAKKCNDEAYLCQDDTGRILGFLYLKTEDRCENYSDIAPSFTPKKRLKVGTFKVDATGFRLGERFIKIIFDNAVERKVDEIYVTLFENREDLATLSNLLTRWGFLHFGIKFSTGESVLVKEISLYNPLLSAKENFPNLLYNKQKFILPIYPQYHTSLLPDSILNTENEVDFLAKEPQRYALQKVYISWGQERNINPGDIVLFYRTGDAGTSKKYSSVLTTIAIVDEIQTGFNSRNKEDFLCHCQNRSVFSLDELNSFWDNHRYNLMILKFIYIKSLVHRPILGFLWDKNIVPAPNGPRPFTRISNDQFEMILNEAQTDLSKFWR